MPIFDTHAHYDDSRFDADRDALLSALPDAGVGLVLDPGCDIPSSQAAAALSERYSHVYAAAGIHPEECGGFQRLYLSDFRLRSRVLRHRMNQEYLLRELYFPHRH